MTLKKNFFVLKFDVKCNLNSILAKLNFGIRTVVFCTQEFHIWKALNLINPTKNTSNYSKAISYDRFNHAVLFKKLIARDVPMCFVRLLQFWYSHQSMLVRWGGSLSRSFKVTNGV